VQLAGERALLDTAKTALGRRDYATALETLDRHAQKYPRAQLAEEREALAVQALVGLGRAADARARAERFKKAFPNSMLTPVVDAALHNP
jgi:outer membrane protein assembly factor BamD (BamD/ComL family)